MKIIKEGRKATDWRRRVKCSCEAELEIEFADLFDFQDDQRDGPFASYTCPCCKHRKTVGLSSSDFPSSVMWTIPRYPMHPVDKVLKRIT